MISLILPYWDRQEAADKALRLLAATYPSLDLEVVVVDDGSITPYVPPDVPLNIRRISMPYKTEPKSCISAWNEGVRQAKGDIIVLSCVEILHDQPVLEDMAAELQRQGPDGYVLAAAWCHESQEWHCHSKRQSERAMPLPAGTGRSFCGMMHRELFERAGGFDEEYRDGAGYEDVDFVYRMLKVGAKFVIRDDLVVRHPKEGASIKWPQWMFSRNLALLQRKWPEHMGVTFVCLKAGALYGPEYVNILRDMVVRNLPGGYPGRFVCLTDDPTGLDPRIETMELPSDLEKWWGKLYFFKRGLFPDGTRLAFLDLDTLIVGRLDDILKYQGQFATLNDFYHPERLGPAVMLWEAGDYAASIWDEWVAQGKPRHPMGDLWWIGQLDQGRFAKQADRLQALFPGAFCSYKADCRPYPPKGTKVVCFHGKPRPHEAADEWVKMLWKVGGGSAAELESVVNTASERIAGNIRSACARGLPELREAAEHGGVAVIVGGGPSLERCLPEIRQRPNATVFAVNGAGKYLHEKGINVDRLVIVDARPENIQFMGRWPRSVYLASQCDPSLFDAAGQAAVVFHMNTDGIVDLLPPGQHCLISSGTTAGLAAMAIAYALGYRIECLYGFDSSYEDSHHAYSQPLNDGDVVVSAVCEGREFKCAPWMLVQVNQFQELATKLAEAGTTIVVGGDGLLPHVARQMALLSNQQAQEAA